MVEKVQSSISNLFWITSLYHIFAKSLRKLFFFEHVKFRKSLIFVSIIFSLFNENLNNFLTKVRKLFKGRNYSKKETVYGDTVHWYQVLSKKDQV